MEMLRVENLTKVYGEGENQEFPETDAATEVVAASVSRLTN